MPLTPDQIDHKLRQHDNEIVSIYDMLAEIKETVVAHDARFDSVDTRLDSVDTRLDNIDGTLTEVLRRIPEPS